MYYLNRFKSDDNGTFGRLVDDTGKRLCYTVELPWHDNLPDISCIPEGVYEVKAYNSPKHGEVWMVQDVPDRSEIEIHCANNIKDLLGCIGLGDALGNINGLPSVMNSNITFTMLLSVLPQSFELTIRSILP